MKKLLLVFFYMASLPRANSQVVFCPPGAKWNYLFIDNNLSPAPFLLNEEIAYVRDSVLGINTAKVLSHSRFFASYNGEHAGLTLILQKGDTIYMRNKYTLHSWQVLFNFGTQTGDTWYTNVWPYMQTGGPMETYTSTVDSIKYIQENGHILKQLFVDGVPITERIGLPGFMFPFVNPQFSDGDYFYKFLCYQDNSFGVKHFTSWPCQYSDKVGITKIPGIDIEVKLYPNPIKAFLSIETDLDTLKNRIEVCFMDIYGREVKKVSVIQNDKIDVSDLNSGIYLITISENSKTVYKTKIIKE